MQHRVEAVITDKVTTIQDKVTAEEVTSTESADKPASEEKVTTEEEHNSDVVMAENDATVTDNSEDSVLEEENLSATDKMPIPQASAEVSGSSTENIETSTFNSSVILNIIKRKELLEKSENELLQALMQTVENNKAQNQKIADLEKRLEDVEKKLDTIEVIVPVVDEPIIEEVSEVGEPTSEEAVEEEGQNVAVPATMEDKTAPDAPEVGEQIPEAASDAPEVGEQMTEVAAEEDQQIPEPEEEETNVEIARA